MVSESLQPIIYKSETTPAPLNDGGGLRKPPRTAIAAPSKFNGPRFKNLVILAINPNL